MHPAPAQRRVGVRRLPRHAVGVAAIPLFASSLERYHARLTKRVGAAIESGRYILDPEVAAFESEFADYLGARGVQARGYYRRPVHLQPGMRAFGGEALSLPATDELARTNLALPMGTDLEPAAVDAVAAACPGGVGPGVRLAIQDTTDSPAGSTPNSISSNSPM